MLAEKYRPAEFGQVIGQERTIAALRWYLDQVTESGKCFLLTGPSGSGKTTLAECAAAYWGIPQFGRIKVESATCDAGRLQDISHDMHIFGPGMMGRKLYLLDEVHTITGRAADRLLSLLEELPAHVLFIATTTEEGWAAPTLSSRWVRLDLQKVSSAAVAQHLERVALAENLPIPADGKWAEKLVKYHGLNIRDQLNQLPARLFGGLAAVAA